MRIIQIQNELTEELLRSHYPNVLYLDVATQTNLRRDSHFDNIHYCFPGPIDSWILLIFNALKLINREAIAQGYSRKKRTDYGATVDKQEIKKITTNFVMRQRFEGKIVKGKGYRFREIYVIENATKRLIPNWDSAQVFSHFVHNT